MADADHAPAPGLVLMRPEPGESREHFVARFIAALDAAGSLPVARPSPATAHEDEPSEDEPTA